ncbi:hypothetical protein DFH08DRAFT_817631 [Mycena albidolilacea]|uniref:Uncharacterized protein n=1 Tax=Mycena albidolilacea TaxID=1033008 RepID=A0AAD7EGX3_9AGAR|nr:hypothetical protein DFH08DRAFT_817631 [Mycena albidolilacea]
MAQKLKFSPPRVPQQSHVTRPKTYENFLTTPRYSHELPILTAGANSPTSPPPPRSAHLPSGKSEVYEYGLADLSTLLHPAHFVADLRKKNSVTLPQTKSQGVRIESNGTVFQSRTPLRKSSKLRVMYDSTASHQKLSSGSSESTTSAALEAYEAAQAEVDSLKILLEQRNQENAKLRAALDASRIRLLDASRQIATIGGIQDTSASLQAASASAEVACRAAVEQLKIFLQGVDIDTPSSQISPSLHLESVSVAEAEAAHSATQESEGEGSSRTTHAFIERRAQSTACITVVGERVGDRTSRAYPSSSSLTEAVYAHELVGRISSPLSTSGPLTPRIVSIHSYDVLPIAILVDSERQGKAGGIKLGGRRICVPAGCARGRGTNETLGTRVGLG